LTHPCLISQASFNWPKSNLPKIHVPKAFRS
jgi:hypothetical protein